MKRLVSFSRIIYSVVLKTLEKPDVLESANLPKLTNLVLLIISLLGLSISQLNSSGAYLNSYGNFINNTISSLVYAPNGWLQTGAFYILGISLLALAVLLQVKVPVKLNLGAIILALIGFALFLIGTFPTRFPGEPFMANIHKVATIAVVALLPVASFLIAATFKTWNYLFLYRYTMISSIFQVLFIFIGGFFLIMHHDLFGLFERVLLWNGQMWLTVIGLYFLMIETKHDFPVLSKNSLVTKPAIYCLLYVYGSMLWPLSLSLIK